ncbi:MAG TPA: glycosyltransferase family 39 protein [Candidatus Sulfotelmatobacter sp.]
MMPTETAANESGDASQPTVRMRSAQVPVWLTLFAICAAGATLRFLFLTRKPFWFDECFSVVAARLDWRNFLHLLWWRECNMSLYYLLLRVWLHCGGTEFFIRSLSVILAVAGLPAIYWLGCLLFDRRTAIISVALLSVNAYHIRYAQEARSYSLFFLLAVLSSGYFCAYLQKASRRNLVCYGLTSILAVYTHFYALLLIGTQGVAFWFSTRDSASAGRGSGLDISRELRRAWIWIAVAVSPLVIFIAKTGAGPIRWIQRPSFRDLVVFYEWLAGNGGWPLLALYAAACATALAPFRKRLFSRENRAGGEIWRLRFLLMWALFPVLLIATLSFVRPIFLGRYFIFCLPALILLAAAGLGRLRKQGQMGIALAVILLFSVKGTLAYHDHDFDVERDGIGAASNYVLDHAQAGDAVLFHIAGTRVGYEFYRSLRGSAGPEIIYPRHGDRLDYRDFTGKPAGEFLRSIPPRYVRVWVVLMNNGGASRPDPTTLMLNEALKESFAEMQEWEFPQVQVRLYRRQ